jgi:polysaccharide export outer membrane protein
VPAFNQTVTVQPDGYVTLQIVGDLYVQNLTVPELTGALVSAYGKTLREPAITIELKDFEKPYFMATGEVGRPGKYDLRGTTTVAQAIAIAGGFTADAKHSQVLLFRTTADDWTEVREINLKNMLAKKNLEEDLLLQPGDLLFIPKSALSKLRLFTPRLTIGPSVRPF